MSIKYQNLMADFVDGAMDADQFETAYLDLHRRVDYLERDYEPIHKVFVAVDHYCGTPDLIDPDEGDLDAEQLKGVVAEQLETLREA